MSTQDKFKLLSDLNDLSKEVANWLPKTDVSVQDIDFFLGSLVAVGETIADYRSKICTKT